MGINCSNAARSIIINIIISKKNLKNNYFIIYTANCTINCTCTGLKNVIQSTIYYLQFISYFFLPIYSCNFVCQCYEGICYFVYANNMLYDVCICYIISLNMKYEIQHTVAESFSARVSELTHPKLPIYSFEIYQFRHPR